MLTELEQTTLTKILNNIKKTDALFDGQPCWEWQMSLTRAGYGQLWVEGKNHYTHRLMYQFSVGPLPEDRSLVIDHLCRNRACCNPAHLEAVPMGENTARGVLLENLRNKTHCKNGHEFTPETERRHKKSGGRYCLICNRNSSLASKAKAKEKT